jgi:RimJ/RimL family protein N-acetyltransferase
VAAALEGLGTEMPRRFVDEVVFASPSTHACLADPDSRSAVSIRMFEKAGFRIVREFHDPAPDETHTLVRLDRADVS